MASLNVNVEDVFPLSSLQQGMIFDFLQNPALSVHHTVICFAAQLDWNSDMFGKALEFMTAKHAMLRTQFRLQKPPFSQAVERKVAREFAVRDIRQGSPEQQQQLILEWIEEEKRTGIDLANKLWRITVHLLGSVVNEETGAEQPYIQFGMSLHHALLDSCSAANFCNELLSMYKLLLLDIPLPAIKPPPAYKQFIELETQALADKTQQGYWDKAFVGAKLPWWSERDKSPSTAFTCAISAETSADIAAIATALQVREKSVWCSVYVALLATLDGSFDVVGSVVIQGRSEILGAEYTLGQFSNTLPIRISTCGCTWAELISKVDALLTEQHSRRHFPLAEVQTRTGLNFSASVFNYTNFEVFASETANSSCDHPQIDSVLGVGYETNHLLAMNVQKRASSNRHLVVINADTTVFGEAFRRRMQTYLLNTINQLRQNLNRPLSSDTLLSPQE